MTGLEFDDAQPPHRQSDVPLDEIALSPGRTMGDRVVHARKNIRLRASFATMPKIPPMTYDPTSLLAFSPPCRLSCLSSIVASRFLWAASLENYRGNDSNVTCFAYNIGGNSQESYQQKCARFCSWSRECVALASKPVGPHATKIKTLPTNRRRKSMLGMRVAIDRTTSHFIRQCRLSGRTEN